MPSFHQIEAPSESRRLRRQGLDKRNTKVGKSNNQRGSKTDGSERRLTLGLTHSSPRTHTLAAKDTNTRRSVALNLTPSYSRANRQSPKFASSSAQRERARTLSASRRSRDASRHAPGDDDSVEKPCRNTVEVIRQGEALLRDVGQRRRARRCIVFDAEGSVGAVGIDD